MKIILFGLLILFTGCTTPILLVNCVDDKIKRNPKNYQSYEVTITSNNYQKTQLIKCHQVYNSQCSVRGNSWIWKEVNNIETFLLDVNKTNKFEIYFPTCNQLNSSLNLSWINNPNEEWSLLENFKYIKHLETNEYICRINGNKYYYEFCSPNLQKRFHNKQFYIPIKMDITKLKEE